MSITALLLTLLPIVILLCMLIVFRKAADVSGIVGWAAISIVAFFFFQTSAGSNSAFNSRRSYPFILCFTDCGYISSSDGLYGENRRTEADYYLCKNHLKRKPRRTDNDDQHRLRHTDGCSGSYTGFITPSHTSGHGIFHLCCNRAPGDRV